MERNENGYSEFRFTNPQNTQNRSSQNGSCRGGCGMKPEDGMCDGCGAHQLAMVYSPYQCWRMLYSPDEALKHGTLFEELYKPLEDCVNG